MAFMGLKKDEIPRDIYLSLDKMFVHVRILYPGCIPDTTMDTDHR